MNMFEAYSAAWDDDLAKGSSHDRQTLLRWLEQVSDRETGIGALNNWPEAMELYLSFWQEGIPPSGLAKALRQTRRRLITVALSRAVTAVRKGTLMSTPKWMVEPPDVTLLERAGLDTSFVVLKLSHSAGVWNDELLGRAVREVPADEDGEIRISVWLAPVGVGREFNLMVGRDPSALATGAVHLESNVDWESGQCDGLPGDLWIPAGANMSDADYSLSVWVRSVSG